MDYGTAGGTRCIQSSALGFCLSTPAASFVTYGRSRPVLFIEEPILDVANEPYLEFSQVDEHLLVVRPHTPIDSPGFSELQLPVIRQLLRSFNAGEGA